MPKDNKIFFSLGLVVAGLLVANFFGAASYLIAANANVTISGTIEGVTPPPDCFLAGTKILMTDGSQKDIEQIKVGEKVLSKNLTYGQLTSNTVEQTYTHQDIRRIIVINQKLFVTGWHPLYLNGSWQLARLANLGDELQTVDGAVEKINSLQEITGPFTVYNLAVAQDNNYFAENILVHNKGGGCTPVAITCGECVYSNNQWTKTCSDGCSSNSFSCSAPAPVAAFVVQDPATGVEIFQGDGPLVLNYLDRSTNNPTQWKWEFLDGSRSNHLIFTSNQQNLLAYVLYNTSTAQKTYTVKLTVNSSSWATTQVKVFPDATTVFNISSDKLNNQVEQFDPADPSDTNALVQFKMNYVSGGLPQTYLWDFGDGRTSTEGSIVTHYYSNLGSYCVTLKTCNDKGCTFNTNKQCSGNNTGIKMSVVKTINCSAFFDATVVDPDPLTLTFNAKKSVQFNNGSAGKGILSYLWTFTNRQTGQVFTRTDKEPLIEFDNQTAVAHNYNVSLVTTCSGYTKNSTQARTNYINVKPRPPEADFNCYINDQNSITCSGLSPLVVNLRDATTESTPSSWAWSFVVNRTGQRAPVCGSKTVANPSCTFTGNRGDIWNATLLVNNAAGLPSSKMKQIKIGNPEAPIPWFTVDKAIAYSGETITFTDKSQNITNVPITGWDWNFDGFNHSTQVSGTLTHVYVVDKQTTFTPTLTLTDKFGQKNTFTIPVVIYPSAPPVAQFSCQPTSPPAWPAPKAVNLIDQSTNKPNYWQWTITLPDGQKAIYYEQNPTVTLAPTAEHSYEVALKVCNKICSDFVNPHCNCTERSQAGCITVAPLPVVALRLTPNLINQGQSASLAWQSLNAREINLDQGLGQVSTNGSNSNGSVQVSPTKTTTYTATATNEVGSSQAMATLSVSSSAMVTVSITATPTLIKAGQTSLLTWNSQNAQTLNIEGIGPVSASGSAEVSPTKTTTYTITGQGENGLSASASITVAVEPVYPPITPDPPELPPTIPPFIENLLPPIVNEVIKDIINNPVVVMVRKFISQPEVKRVTRQTVAPIIVATSAIAVSTSFGLLDLLSLLRFIFTEPFYLLFRRRRQGWGTVYNTFTKQPIDLAVVRLYSTKDNKLVTSRVTNTRGQYLILIEPGEYYLEVTKQDFVFPSNVLFGKTQDEKFTDLYTGGKIIITAEQPNIALNIPLDSHLPELSDNQIIRHYHRQALRLVLLSLGPIAAVVSFVIAPSYLMFSLILVHLFFYWLFRKLSYRGVPKSWGSVFDKLKSSPVATAVTRIYEPTYHRLLEVQVTDRQGRYGFLADNNIYYVTAQKAGYKTAQSTLVDLRQKDSSVVKLDLPLELESGGANLEIEKQKSILGLATAKELNRVEEKVHAVKGQVDRVQLRVGKTELGLAGAKKQLTKQHKILEERLAEQEKSIKAVETKPVTKTIEEKVVVTKPEALPEVILLPPASQPVELPKNLVENEPATEENNLSGDKSVGEESSDDPTKQPPEGLVG
ncbi:MAG: PKD domain-containing protein [Candidatus Buchananbacteria bacterium]